MKLIVLGLKETYESTRIIEESKAKNVQASFHKIKDLVFMHDHKTKVFIKGNNILDYDAVLFRGVGKSLNIISSLAEYLYNNNKLVIDSKLALDRYSADKTLTLFLCNKYNLPYPKTFQFFTKSSLMEGIEQIEFPVIIKEISSSQGKGVFLARNKKELTDIYNQHQNASELIIQKKLREHAEDYRVFVVGNKALGVMKKTAKENEYRSNVSQGGQTEIIKNETIMNLGLKAAQLTNTQIAGVDVMLDENNIPYILEINRAPQFKGFEQVSGINVAGEILDYIKIQSSQ